MSPPPLRPYGPTRDDRPRVLARVITSPYAERGERLVLFVESRTVSDLDVLIYSVTKDEWRVEQHRQAMWRTRRANATEVAEIRQALEFIGEGHVRILQAAPRTWRDPDESPADDGFDAEPGT